MRRSLTELMASIQKWKAGKALGVVEPIRVIYVNLRDNTGLNMLQAPQKKIELVGLVWYISIFFADFHGLEFSNGMILQGLSTSMI